MMSNWILKKLGLLSATNPLESNIRYCNYARAHGRTAAEQFTYDKNALRYRPMGPFMDWKFDRCVEFLKEYAISAEGIEDAIDGGSVMNIEAYIHGNERFDAWLTKWVDERTK
ncbi:hypothetical protein [Allomesorhizobium camelthorni]|uniref:Uncharacterized protein n=1 Tax=Allomesorhizobium camelthorni TaxID=475069 RepID=A0A6G4WIQ2_9HYPH|nr:hypothetical protein [Mesorhizobium camelthorni]NGO54000.1 hypothetical protein [Mesorhizobium camelthorni]